MLCHYPDPQKRVFAEIDNFIKTHGRVSDFNERDKPALCIPVIKESMRYRPKGPFGVSHTSDKDSDSDMLPVPSPNIGISCMAIVIVDGYLIPKDCTIIFNLASMHTNSERYENIFDFIPERFMDSLKAMHASANGSTEQRDTYNFRWGRRICASTIIDEDSSDLG